MKRIILTILTLLMFSAFAEKYTVVDIGKGRAKFVKDGSSIAVGDELDEEEEIRIKGSKGYIKLSDNKIIKGEETGEVTGKVKDLIQTDFKRPDSNRP